MPDNHNIQFGNGANFSGASGLAFGANSQATANSNNRTTNNTTNNQGGNKFGVKVDKQYGNTNMGDGQHNAGSTYNFGGKSDK